MKRLGILAILAILAFPVRASAVSDPMEELSAARFYDWLMKGNYRNHDSFPSAFEAFERSVVDDGWKEFRGLAASDPERAKAILFGKISIDGGESGLPDGAAKDEADAMMAWLSDGRKWEGLKSFQEAFDSWETYRDGLVWKDFVAAASGGDPKRARGILDRYYRQ